MTRSAGTRCWSTARSASAGTPGSLITRCTTTLRHRSRNPAAERGGRPLPRRPRRRRPDPGRSGPSAPGFPRGSHGSAGGPHGQRRPRPASSRNCSTSLACDCATDQYFFCNLVRAERCARPDLPGDGDAGTRMPSPARPTPGTVAAGRSAVLPSETVPQSQGRVVSPAAAGEQDGPASGGPHRRDSTAEVGAGSDDQQVAWIGGGAIGPGGVCHCRPPFLDARYGSLRSRLGRSGEYPSYVRRSPASRTPGICASDITREERGRPWLVPLSLRRVPGAACSPGAVARGGAGRRR
jgi:hypothetical protein